MRSAVYIVGFLFCQHLFASCYDWQTDLVLSKIYDQRKQEALSHKLDASQYSLGGKISKGTMGGGVNEATITVNGEPKKVVAKVFDFEDNEKAITYYQKDHPDKKWEDEIATLYHLASEKNIGPKSYGYANVYKDGKLSKRIIFMDWIGKKTGTQATTLLNLFENPQCLRRTEIDRIFQELKLTEGATLKDSPELKEAFKKLSQSPAQYQSFLNSSQYKFLQGMDSSTYSALLTNDFIRPPQGHVRDIQYLFSDLHEENVMVERTEGEKPSFKIYAIDLEGQPGFMQRFAISKGLKNLLKLDANLQLP